MNLPSAIHAIAGEFQIAGDFVSAEPFGSGHINDTYRVTFAAGDARCRYILQRLNHTVFQNPLAVMENFQRVTAHLSQKFAGVPDAARRALTLLPARDGNYFHRAAAGDFWHHAGVGFGP